MASCGTRHPLGDRSGGSFGTLQRPRQPRVRRCTHAATRACTSHGTHAAVPLPRRSLAGARVPRRQVEAGAAGPLPPCHSWRGYRLARAQRQEQARADGRTDARSDGHVERALGGMGATRRTIPSTPTALVCVSRPSRAQAEVGGSSSRARAAAHSACASARSRLVAGRYDRAADSVEACNDISDVDQEAPLVVLSLIHI